MAILLAQLAPQRSTQYSDLVSALAQHELLLSPVGAQISGLTPVELAGQSCFLLVARWSLPGTPPALSAPRWWAW